MTMNTEIYNKIAGGASVADLLKAYENELRAAEAKYKAEQEEKKRKAEEEAKRAKEAQARAQRDLDAKKITELANRALNGNTTAEDVSWLWTRYASKKWNKSEAILNQLLKPDEVDEMIDMAVKMLTNLDPLVKMMDTTWEDVAKEADIIIKREKKKDSKSEDDIIRNFINKIC